MAGFRFCKVLACQILTALDGWQESPFDGFVRVDVSIFDRIRRSISDVLAEVDQPATIWIGHIPLDLLDNEDGDDGSANLATILSQFGAVQWVRSRERCLKICTAIWDSNMNAMRSCLDGAGQDQAERTGAQLGREEKEDWILGPGHFRRWSDICGRLKDGVAGAPGCGELERRGEVWSARRVALYAAVETGRAEYRRGRAAWWPRSAYFSELRRQAGTLLASSAACFAAYGRGSPSLGVPHSVPADFAV